MRVLIDVVGARMLDRVDEQIVQGKARYYYAPREPDALFHLVSRCGPFPLLVGRVVDAAVGWGVGWHGKCHPDHEGLQLMKVTLFRVTGGRHEKTLSGLIEESRSLPRKRPPRRARWARPWGFEK